MSALVNGFTWFINAIRLAFELVFNIIRSIAMLFRYLLTIINLAFTAILTLPPYIQAFAYLTIGISIIYIIVGRNTGKSD